MTDRPQINPVDTAKPLAQRIAEDKAKSHDSLKAKINPEVVAKAEAKALVTHYCLRHSCSFASQRIGDTEHFGTCPYCDELEEQNYDAPLAYGSAEVPPEPYQDPTAYDAVDKPKHYMLIPEKDVEVLHVIEASIEANGIPAIIASNYGNVLKYLLRCGRKGKYLQDLKKAQFYLNRLIENQEMKEFNSK